MNIKRFKGIDRKKLKADKRVERKFMESEEQHKIRTHFVEEPNFIHEFFKVDEYGDRGLQIIGYSTISLAIFTSILVGAYFLINYILS